MTNLSCGVRFTCRSAGCSVHTEDEDKSLEPVCGNKMGQIQCVCVCVCVRGEKIG